MLSLIIEAFDKLHAEAFTYHKKYSLKNYTLLVLIFIISCTNREIELMNQAREKLNEKRYAEALSLLNKWIKKFGASENAADVYNMRGVAHLNLGKQAKALNDFNRAIAVDSTNYKYFYNMGNTKRIINLPDEAIADYTRALHLDSTRYEIYLNRALCHIQQRRLIAAITDLGQAIDYCSVADKYPFYYRGQTYLKLNQVENAIKDLQQSIALDVNFAEAHFTLALAIISNEKVGSEQSCRHIKKAVALNYVPAQTLLAAYCQ